MDKVTGLGGVPGPIRQGCSHNEGTRSDAAVEEGQCPICLLARVQELEASTIRQQQANDILDDQLGQLQAENKELLRSRQLHDATCFTEAGKLRAKVQELEREAAEDEAQIDSYRKIVDEIAAIIDPHVGTADTPENVFETVQRLVADNAGLRRVGECAMEDRNKAEREVAELKKAAPELIREHRKAYYDQIDCWKGEPNGPCQCPACKMERLTT